MKHITNQVRDILNEPLGTVHARWATTTRALEKLLDLLDESESSVLRADDPLEQCPNCDGHVFRDILDPKDLLPNMKGFSDSKERQRLVFEITNTLQSGVGIGPVSFKVARDLATLVALGCGYLQEHQGTEPCGE